MNPRRVYVVGAGLAGLAAAVSLVGRGQDVTVIEAAPQAGGRCRSYFDAQLDQVIDNGNHFIVSGNGAAMRYLETIGSRDALVAFDDAGLPWVDIRTGLRWTIQPNDGVFPSWMFQPHRRVPDTRLRDYLGLMRLIGPVANRRLEEVIACKGMLWERLFHPFFLGALNTEPGEASAALASALVRETFARGGKAYRIRIAHPTLASVFVDPALDYLKKGNARLQMGERVRRIGFERSRVVAIDLAQRTIGLDDADEVILAVPPWVASELVPGLATPDHFCPIVNAHFKIAAPPGAPPMLGVIGGTAQWIFSFADRISVTISAADAVVDTDREQLARSIWGDICAALPLSEPLPPWQIVKEKRATFAATPEQVARRPQARTRWSNLVLAGDWTQTGLPATIEGAIRSGHTAAQMVA